MRKRPLPLLGIATFLAFAPVSCTRPNPHSASAHEAVLLHLERHYVGPLAHVAIAAEGLSLEAEPLLAAGDPDGSPRIPFANLRTRVPELEEPLASTLTRGSAQWAGELRQLRAAAERVWPVTSGARYFLQCSTIERNERGDALILVVLEGPDDEFCLLLRLRYDGDSWSVEEETPVFHLG